MQTASGKSLPFPAKAYCRCWAQPDLLNMHMVTCCLPDEGHASSRDELLEQAAGRADGFLLGVFLHS